MEVHIHPFQLHSVVQKKNHSLYLHSSPEFCLKELLSLKDESFDNIFSISYCFRDEPTSPIHRSQFVMLEWYRKNARYEAIMEDVEGLLVFCLSEAVKKNLPVREEVKNQKLVKKTMQEIFQEILGIDILNYLDVGSIKRLLLQFPEVPLPQEELPWDDYFFLLFLNKIEPILVQTPLLMITEFPAPLSALSTLKENDPRVCERFELYVRGVEVANCFNELTDLAEQKKRFQEQKIQKQQLYSNELPEPKSFYTSFERGLPSCSGIALGVERLLTSLFEVDQPFFY